MLQYEFCYEKLPCVRRDLQNSSADFALCHQFGDGSWSSSPQLADTAALSESSAIPVVDPPHPAPNKSTIYASSGLLAASLPLLPGRLQLSVALRLDLLLPSCQHVLRRDVARGAVQADGVVVVHVCAHQTRASSSDSGVPGRMHSPLSDLCQRSIFPFDCG